MPYVDCICIIQYTNCGAIHQNLILIFRESKPTIENRAIMDGSTFFGYGLISFESRTKKRGMALINCSECGQNVSDKASICPHCGNPLTPKVFCDECGNELTPDDKVCPKCGCPVPTKADTSTQNTNNRPPKIISDTEREYYYPKHSVFTSMIEVVSHERTLKMGTFDENSGVIRATTNVSLTGWGEIININIT